LKPAIWLFPTRLQPRILIPFPLDNAETFGAAALGLSKDEYYATLCEMADEIGGCGSV
jgi:hypothetical protein